MVASIGESANNCGGGGQVFIGCFFVFFEDMDKPAPTLVIWGWIHHFGFQKRPLSSNLQIPR
jgi:hypothetical protein